MATGYEVHGVVFIFSSSRISHVIQHLSNWEGNEASQIKETLSIEAGGLLNNLSYSFLYLFTTGLCKLGPPGSEAHACGEPENANSFSREAYYRKIL